MTDKNQTEAFMIPTGNDRLLLKFGSVKGWCFDDVNCEACLLLQKYLNGSSTSLISDQPDPERLHLLFDIIDKLDGVIDLDGVGEFKSKDAAKTYLVDYNETL